MWLINIFPVLCIRKRGRLVTTPSAIKLLERLIFSNVWHMLCHLHVRIRLHYQLMWSSLPKYLILSSFSHAYPTKFIFLLDGPDEVLITPSKYNYTYNEGHLLDDIFCTSECYPSCLYKWTKLSSIVSVDHGILSLGNLTRQKRGLYICKVTNPSTQLQMTLQITVNVRCKILKNYITISAFFYS